MRIMLCRDCLSKIEKEKGEFALMLYTDICTMHATGKSQHVKEQFLSEDFELGREKGVLHYLEKNNFIITTECDSPACNKVKPNGLLIVSNDEIQFCANRNEHATV